MNIEPVLHELGGRETLAEGVARICSAPGLEGTALALVAEDGCWSTGFGQDQQARPFLPTTRVPVGCAVKIFVTALVAGLVSRGKVALDDEIARHLDLGGNPRESVFRETTVRHLLSRTDGVGHTPFGLTPVTEQGFIDVRRLLESVSAHERTFPPGQQLTPGHFGFALLGAVVERHNGRPFALVLRSLIAGLAEPSGTSARPGECGEGVDGTVCPAFGRGFTSSAEQVGRLLQFYLNPRSFELPLFGPTADFSAFFEHFVPSPGWAMITTGTALGWKTFAGDWVGHDGTGDGNVLIMRLHPKRKIGVVFVGLGQASTLYASLGRLLGRYLPEFARLDSPRVLNDDERDNLRMSPYVGVFRSGARHVSVTCQSTHHLTMTLSELAGGRSSEIHHAYLLPATRDVFFLRPAANGLALLQYLRSEATGEFNRVWDGFSCWKLASGKESRSDPAGFEGATSVPVEQRLPTKDMR